MRRRGIVVTCAFALASATVLACAGSAPRADVSASSPASPSTGDAAAPAPPAADATTSTTVAPGTQLGSGQPVTIAFAGDINFEGDMGARLSADPSTAIGPFSTVLTSADLSVANLETAITTGGTPEAKDFTFRAPPSAIDALRASGIDVVSMANNHGRDYGPDGLVDSLAVKDAQPDHYIIGIGHDDTDAYSPFTTTVNGQRISVIGATQVIDDELVSAWTATSTNPGLASAKRVDALVAAVRQARADSDTVVVFLHWGIERNTCPSAEQESLAQTLVDAGADIVIGGHAHRLQGAGRLGSAFVGYGLGNFDFYANGDDAAKSGIVEVTVTGRRIDGYQFLPGHISASVARPLTGADADAATAEWTSLRGCTNLTP